MLESQVRVSSLLAESAGFLFEQGGGVGLLDEDEGTGDEDAALHSVSILITKRMLGRHVL